jgi:hypothetical protein
MQGYGLVASLARPPRTVSVPDPSAPGRGRSRWPVLGVTFVGCFLVPPDVTIVEVALPAVRPVSRILGRVAHWLDGPKTRDKPGAMRFEILVCPGRRC